VAHELQVPGILSWASSTDLWFGGFGAQILHSGAAEDVDARCLRDGMSQ
jgi:hypothetical protein